MRITRTILLATCILLSTFTHTQNLLVNPGAEVLPAGSGWTIITGSTLVCAGGTAAGTYSNWTMIPDGTANYPIARSGTRTFFAGCGNVGDPAFELRQLYTLSGTDATQADVSNLRFSFSGYIQTPLATQGDAGRFTVDYLGATSNVLATYTASQAGNAASGNAWNLYSDTRTAPVGTRQVRVRLISTLATGPAINAYYDDISLTKAYIVALPIDLESFTAKDSAGYNSLRWTVSNALSFEKFVIERSDDGVRFSEVGAINYRDVQTAYYFQERPSNTPLSYYRLKLVDQDGKSTYSQTVLIRRVSKNVLLMTPNPAVAEVNISGLSAKGEIQIANASGKKVFQQRVTQTFVTIDTRPFGPGIYLVTYSDGINITTGKLLVK